MRTPRIACMFLVSLVVGFGPNAQAQSNSDERASRCGEAVAERLGKHFGLGHFAFPESGMTPSAGNGGLLVAGTCKPWPTNSARTIAAFAYDAGVEYEKQLLIAVIERPDNRVIASYKGVIPEDAATEVSSSSLRLDTARYTLSKQIRAFGLRLSTFRDRCTYEGGYDDELTLFVVDGQTIRPVLTDTMSHWTHGGGNRCAGDDVPRIDANTVISVEPTKSKGFADLRFTAARSDGKKPVSVVVKYTGDHYDLAQWSAVFNAWWY